ncbi:MAG: hypothetical protein ACUVS1_10525 [Actinomycetota bacterium]
MNGLPEEQKARIRSLSGEYEGILRARFRPAVVKGSFGGIDIPMTARTV